MISINWKSCLEKFEYAYSTFFLTVYSTEMIPLILTDGASEEEAGSVQVDFSLNRNIFLLSYLITFCLIFLRWKKVLRVFLSNRPLFFYYSQLFPPVFGPPIPSLNLVLL